MKVLYYLPFFSLSLVAHIDNTIHLHLIESFINLIILFSFLGLGLTLPLIIKTIYRRFV
tara:strand:- start:446 stop:622 length:177 start_codon:yes stop_codon:yes gene_type:complete